MHQYSQGNLIQKKPQSAIMFSFFSQSAPFSESLKRTISLSEIDSDNKFLIKITVQDGAIHMFTYLFICMIIFISFICNVELVA